MAEKEIWLKPGEQIKPKISTEGIHALVLKLYKLHVLTIKELNSYDDLSFYITVREDDQLPFPDDYCPHGYIFKIVNSLDSKNQGFIDAQTQMMLYLGNNGIVCPKPIRNVNGAYMTMEKLNDQDDENCVRMLSFIPGTILFTVEYTKELFYEVGQLAAKMDLALMRFENPELHINRIWNLSAVPKLHDFTFAVSDESRRNLATQVINHFRDNVVPHYDKLASGAIHGDMNEQNILVQADPQDPSKYHVAGIIDFGDIHHNYYVFEIALACMYMMIECKSMDVLDAPGHVLAGYNSARPLPAHEFQLLKPLIAGRFAQSLVLGAYSYSQNPDPYVLTTSHRGWYCLERLWQTPQEELYQRWNQIIDSYSQ